MAAAGTRAVAAGLLSFLAAVAFASWLASASSYSGSGDWTIAPAASETVVGETLNISGNLSVLGTLRLVNSTLVVDRNITVAGALDLNATSLTFSVDGPGTNFLSVGPGASVSIADFDGNADTSADASLFRADAFAFNGSFAPGSILTISNSRVEKAGWAVPAPFAHSPGFRLTAAALTVRGAAFQDGFELFVLINASNASVARSSFEGFASVFNITGGTGHRFDNVSFANDTLSIRLEDVAAVSVTGLRAGPAGPIAYAPPRAPPAGTAVQVLNGSHVLLSGLNVTGDPLVAFPRNLAAFVVALSDNVTVASSTGFAGDSFGQVVSTRSFSMLDVDIRSFLRPTVIDFVDGFIVDGFRVSDSEAGLELRTASNWEVRGVDASGIPAAAILGTGLSGTGRLSQIAAEACTGLANLTWSNPGALFADNLSATGVDYALGITGTSFSSLEINDSNFQGVNLTAVRVNASLVAGLLFSNITVARVGQWVLNVTTVNAARIDVRGVAATDAVSGVVAIAADAADDLSFQAMSAINLTGPLVRLNINGTLASVSFAGLSSANSSGSLIDVFALTLRGLAASDLNMSDAQLFPPPPAPAGVTIVCTAAQDVAVADLLVNITSREGFHLTAVSAVRVLLANFTLRSVAGDGLVVEGTGSPWQLSVQNITSENGGSATVHLIGVLGAVTVEAVDASGAIGIQIEGGEGTLVSNVSARGDGYGFVLFGSRNLVLRNITADSGVGVEMISCRDVLVDNATLRGSQWAMRGIVSTNVTVQGLRSQNTTGGISLRNVTQFSLVAPQIEFRGTGIQITLLSRLVTVDGARLSTPAGAVSGTMLQVSFSTDVGVSDLAFAGTCAQGVRLQTTSRVNLSQVRAPGCGSGIDISGSTFVNITDFAVKGATSGSGLSVSSSSDIRALRGDVSNAAILGLLVTGSTRLEFSDTDARDSAGDGAFLAFVTNSSFTGLRVDGARGMGLRILSSGPNLVMSKTSATSCWDGVEILSSVGVTLEDINASGALFTGIYSDPASFDNTIRNLTVSGSGTNGLLVAANGTRLIDGNFSGNVQGGIAVWPGVRLDWTIEVAGSLSDERIELTGDLLIGAGATFTAVDAVITIDQTARLSAFQPYSLISIGPDATLSLVAVTLEPRDKTVPYAILASPGSTVSIRYSTLKGGSPSSPESAFRASGSTIDIFWSDFSAWGAPLDLTNCESTLVDATFSKGASGPRLVGGNATLINVTSTLASVDGLAVEGAHSLVSTDLFVAYNAGRGLFLDGVESAQLDGLVTLGNSQGEVVANASTVVGSRWSLKASQATGLVARGGALLDVNGLSSVSNDGSGVVLTAMGVVRLVLTLIDSNGGTGILARDVGDLTIEGGQVSANVLFGLELAGSGAATVEGVRFDGDGFASLRLEDAVRATIGNSTMATSADHAIMAVGSSDSVFTNVGASGNLTGLLAADGATVFLLNSTMAEPTVLGSAEVSIGWHLRVVVQTAAGAPAGAVPVNVTQAAGGLVAQALTDPAGSTPLLAILERVLAGNATLTFYGPQDVTAQSPTLGRAWGSINLTRYSVLGLRLDPDTPVTAAEAAGSAGQRGWFKGPVDVSLRSTDDRADGLTLFYRIEGGPSVPWSVANGTGMVAVASLTVGAEGPTTIEFYAIDAAGNQEALQRLMVKTDLHEPSISVAAVGAIVYTPEVDFRWFGQDGAGSGVVSFSVDYADSSGRFTNWLNGTINTSATFVASDGDYTFSFIAYDAAGRASVPLLLHFTAALNGFVRLRPVNEAGDPVANVTVWLNGALVLENVSGSIEVQGVRAGIVSLLLTAPGYDNLTLTVEVRGHEITDEGNVTMRSAPAPPGGIDLTAGLLALGALLVLTVAYGARIRLKWRKRDRLR